MINLQNDHNTPSVPPTNTNVKHHNVKHHTRKSYVKAAELNASTVMNQHQTRKEDQIDEQGNGGGSSSNQARRI